jgi:hypothetical protein
MRVAVDGPRAGHATDGERVRLTREAVTRIDWTDDVRTLFRGQNVGLERAVPGAVSWALEEAASVIVIEDDVNVGPEFIDFAQTALRKFESRDDVMHVSGYNVVPHDLVSDPDAPVRLSRVPESFAWATWRRAWQFYDPSLEWGTNCSVSDLTAVLGSRWAALRWKQNFSLAHHGRISSWAYRWAASMWQHNGYCLSPNRNLITYRGYQGGTHTRRRARWQELPIERLDVNAIDGGARFDTVADSYLHRQVFHATPVGVALGPAEALALRIVQRS